MVPCHVLGGTEYTEYGVRSQWSSCTPSSSWCLSCCTWLSPWCLLSPCRGFSSPCMRPMAIESMFLISFSRAQSSRSSKPPWTGGILRVEAWFGNIASVVPCRVLGVHGVRGVLGSARNGHLVHHRHRHADLQLYFEFGAKVQGRGYSPPGHGADSSCAPRPST